MRILKQLTVSLFLVTMVSLVLVGCAEEILAPRELKAQLKINVSAAEGPIDHGWLTIDNAAEIRHRMALVDNFLQSETIELLPGSHHFEIVAVDVEETVLYRGARTDTIPADVDAFTIEILLSEVQPDCAVVPGTPDFGEVLIGDSVTDTLIVANSESATGSLAGEISLQPPGSQHFNILTGAGPFELSPGQEWVVVVEFHPQSTGSFAVTVATGSDCDDIEYQGIGRQDTGTITINAEPNSLGAPWSLSGPGGVQAGNGDATLQNMLPGSYTLTWNPVTGWNAPAPQTRTLTANGNLTFTGTYSQQLGTITINPEPNSLDAPWSLNGPGGVQAGNGDATLQNMLPGSYTLTWNPVTGWNAPAPQTQTLTSDGSLTFTGIYVQQLGTITINPEPNSLDAPWSLNGPGGVQAGNGDATLQNMLPGSYTLTWNAVSGWNAPAPQTRTLTANGNLTFTGVYSLQPGCNIDNPVLDFGQVPVDGGSADRQFTITNTGGGVLSGNVSESCDHYSITLNSGIFNLSAGQARTVTVQFDPLAAGIHDCTISTGTDCAEVSCTGQGQDFGTVVIVPHPIGLGPTWALEGPAGYQRNGVGFEELFDMVVGEYTITWGQVSQYNEPPPETLILAANDTVEFHGAYTLQTGTIVIDAIPNSISAPWSLFIPNIEIPIRTGFGDATLTEMEPNNYTLVWGSVTNWIAPPGQTHYLSGNETFTFTGTYTQSCFYFDDGSTQNWSFDGNAYDNDNTTAVGTNIGMFWEDNTDYPGSERGNPLGDGIGSLEVGISQSIDVGVGSYWFTYHRSPSLSPLDAWQYDNSTGVRVQFHNSIASTIRVRLWVSVNGSWVGNGDPSWNFAMPLGSWFQHELLWSDVGITTGDSIDRLYIMIRGNNGVFYNGALYIDDVCPIARQAGR